MLNVICDLIYVKSLVIVIFCFVMSIQEIFRLIFRWFMLRVYVNKIFFVQREHLQRGGTDGMIPVTLQESGTAARAKVRAHHGNHQTETKKGNMHQTGTEKGTGIEIGLMILKVRKGEIVRRVEVERGMTTTGTEAEKETGIGGDDQNKLFLGLVFVN